MNRRNFLRSGSLTGATLAGMSVSAQSSAGNSGRSLIEIRKILFRNNRENKRAVYLKFLENAYAPALKRAGVEAMGFFNNDVGPDKPHVLCVLSYGAGGAMIDVQDRLGADKAFQAALQNMHGKGPVYERVESSLLRAFSTVPKVEIPKSDAPMYFELRTYESDDSVSLAKKIDMFERGGEIAIFRKYGLQPVFFGEALIGERIPNLTYMVAFPNAAARTEAWRKFGTSPEWAKVKSTPGWSDGEVVSSITNATYSGLPFSEIR